MIFRIFARAMFSLNVVALLLVSCKNENAIMAGYIVAKSIDVKKIVLNTNASTVQFDAPAGTDVTIALQEALNNYKVVNINKSYIISNTLTIPSGVTLTGCGLNNAVLKAANTRTGLLNSRGIYIDLTNKTSVNVWGIKLQPADNMLNQSGWANAVILLSNSSNCSIYGNNFDFSFPYSKGMDAVWITGPSSNNIISNNYIKTLGITYCENGAFNNTVQYNQLVNSNANALGGIGNGSSPCINNKVLNNTIENAGRMGIEDQQNVIGTLISGNIIKGTGKLKGINPGEGSGISAVAISTVVKNNKITDAKDFYIEVGGSNKVSVINNNIYDTGICSGIFVNFLGNAIADVSKTTIVKGNTVVGCLKCIETFGNTTTQYVTIDSNTIADPISHAINIDAGSSIKSIILLKRNNITFNNKTNSTRYGISTYTRTISGQQNYTFNIDHNIITYKAAATKGTGYDNSMIIAFDNAVISYNTINGYTGGLNYGVSNNGAITKGVSFVGNIVNLAIWNIAQFPK